jgi:hypothetical protein
MTKPRKVPPKVEEPAAAYGVEKSEIRYASAKDIEASNKQLMRAHRETLRKLAK